MLYEWIPSLRLAVKFYPAYGDLYLEGSQRLNRDVQGPRLLGHRCKMVKIEEALWWQTLGLAPIFLSVRDFPATLLKQAPSYKHEAFPGLDWAFSMFHMFQGLLFVARAQPWRNLTLVCPTPLYLWTYLKIPELASFFFLASLMPGKMNKQVFGYFLGRKGLLVV